MNTCPLGIQVDVHVHVCEQVVELFVREQQPCSFMFERPSMYYMYMCTLYPPC